ncbi:MAG: exodeoxyribonuclease VII small subunit [Chitinophagaceae bacterium]|nr:MAG: exodeoxyribonuclease VII small subunit [Chitinophagaceae bacterium]
METNLTYEKAYAELKQLTQEIETESVSVDVLADKVQRASFLISFCQDRLRATETEVSKIIGQMNAK